MPSVRTGLDADDGAGAGAVVWTGGAGTGVGEAGGEAGGEADGEGEAEVAGEEELGTGLWADVPTEPHEATASAGAATATSTNSHHGRRMTTSARRPGSLGDHRLRPPAPILTMAHFSRELQGRKSPLGGRWARYLKFSCARPRAGTATRRAARTR